MTAWRRQVEAFREWWSRRPTYWWRVVGVAALALVLLLIALAVWQRAALPILLLTPVAAGIILGLLWADAREWLIENAIPQGALLLSGWLLGAFVLWLVVNAVWANQAQRLAGDHTALTVATVPLTAGVAYPAVALADAADNALQLSFSADAAVPLPRQALTATVTLSDTLAFATAGGPSTRDFLVPLTLGQPGSQRIGIVNSGVYGGWRGHEATITVRLCAAGNVCADDLKLTVRPEGQDGYAVRRFVNSTIDQSSPIILLLLFLVPGVAVWTQKVLEGRQGALQKRRQAEFELLVKEFRGYLRVLQPDDAKKSLVALNQPIYETFNLVERDLARRLYQLATLDYPLPGFANPRWENWPNAWIIDSGPEWPREFVAAGLLAVRRIEDSDLEATYLQRPGWEVGQFDFQKTVARRLRSFVDDNVWPAVMRVRLDDDDALNIERQRVNKKRREARVERRSVLSAVPCPYPVSNRRLLTPFDSGDASRREEIRFLRDGQAFWGNHPLLRDLRHGHYSVIVRGAPGSGCRALSQMLPLDYVNDAHDLFVQIKGEDARAAIVGAVAGQLLEFVLRHPIIVSLLPLERQQKLAQFLIWLKPDNRETLIQNRLDELSRSADLAVNDPEQQARCNLTHQELARFWQLLGAGPEASKSVTLDDDPAWTDVFLESVHILGFKNVVFVINLEELQLVWLSGLGNFNDLCHQGIHFWLFVDDNFPRDRVPDAPNMAHDLRLAWPEEYLPYFRAMLEWRFEKYLDLTNRWPQRERRRALARCFADGEMGLKRLIEASKVNGEYNPRKFMTRWRAAAGDKEVGQLITTADVDRALRQEGGS